MDRNAVSQIKKKAPSLIIGGSILMLLTGSLFWTLSILVGLYIANTKVEAVHIFSNTIMRDVKAGMCLLRFYLRQAKNIKHNRTIPIIFDDAMQSHPKKVAIQWKDVSWTYTDLYEYSNAVGNHFRSLGYGPGDTVAIVVGNRPEFIALWLGLSKIGVNSALINFNLTGNALLHCVNISNAKAVIFGGMLSKSICEIESKLSPDLKLYHVLHEEKENNSENIPANSCNIDSIFQSGLRLPPPKPKGVSYFDKLMYIYTSGTTGLPKAAVISHNRYFYMACMSNLMVGYDHSDSIYCSLPLYHSNGGIVGAGQCVCFGLTLTIRSKFSASAFWNDCKKYQCTAFLYIGEIARYLLSRPPSAADKDHNIRLAIGNGLKPEFWREFVNRFNIPRVAEFYGATEGNANMLNTENVEGSCGFTSVIFPSVYPICLLKIDDNKELIRDKNGLCIRCKAGEQGMLVGKIKPNSPIQKFDGYVDQQATSKKMAFDIFKKGDCVFLTGDVLIMDKYGNMRFKDRTGDTFRWKGENVSTAECEADLAKILKHHFTVAVYGVDIPGTEGKAGMACIVDPDNTVDMEEFHQGVISSIVSYARPIFVRITKSVTITGTHKISKVKLQKEGYDIGSFEDTVYFLNKNGYTKIDTDLYQNIISGSVRV